MDKYNLQSDPPNFGNARIVSRLELSTRCLIRRLKVRLKSRNKKIKLIKNEVSIVILSCKRLNNLKKLVIGFNKFLKEIETFKNIRKILVDNGSDKELIKWSKKSNFFDLIIANKKNLGMATALDNFFSKCDSEYILLLEDDFEIFYSQPFLSKCIKIFDEFPEIGIIRLKNQNNWGKKHRVIGPLRKTTDNTYFWTWLPSLNGKLNVWASGSVIFKNYSYRIIGKIKSGKPR